MATKTFPEEVAVGGVLKSSAPLRAFFETERPKLTKPIRWERDLDLPPGILGRTTRGIEEDVVKLLVVPAEDPALVAHELAHLVLDVEGFPSTEGLPGDPPHDFEQISAALTGMLHHPLVHQRLSDYGFDVSAIYEEEVEEARRGLRQVPSEPTEPYWRLLWLFNYTDKVLNWEWIQEQRGETQDEHHFQTWFRGRYPGIARDAKILAGIVRATGFDTPKKQQELFVDMIRRFKLDQTLMFIDPKGKVVGPLQKVRLGPLF